MAYVLSCKIHSTWNGNCVCVCVLGSVQLFPTPWTVAHQAALSMGFPWQEYWSELPFSSPGHIPNPEIEHAFPTSLLS